MKRSIWRFGALALALLCAGCGRAPEGAEANGGAPSIVAPSIAAESPAPSPSPSPLQYPAWEPAQAPLELDMDGDGQLERVELHQDEEDGCTIRIGDYSDSFAYLYGPQLYVGDMRFGDGSREIFLIGDTGSNDYVSYIYRLSCGQMERLEIQGSVKGADGEGSLRVETVINVLGTYGASCSYSLLEDGSLALNSPYAILDAADLEERALTLLQDIHGSFETGGEFSSVTLLAGMRLRLTETDGTSYALLQGENGESILLSIALSPDGYTILVDGIPEADCFSNLLYAG